MAKTIGVGVIGMGWMGIVHSRCYLRVGQHFPDLNLCPRLIICADEVADRSSEAKDRFGFERQTSNWQKVIADPDVEIVNIAAPNSMHLEIVQAAAKAGKHIFCEKPVGRNPRETANIEYAARQANILTCVGYNYRWAPLVQYARQLIQEGRLGQITHYRGRFFAGYASNPHAVLSWRFQRELSGLGTLGDLMSHVIDMAQMIVSPVKSAVSNSKTFISQRPLPTPGEGTHFTVQKGGPAGDVTNEDYVGTLVQFNNGAQGTLEACRIISGLKCQMAFEVNGTEGALNWDFERMNELNLYLPNENNYHDGHVRVLSGPEHPFHLQFNPAPGTGLGYDDLKVIESYNFLKAIEHGKQMKPGFAEALSVARVQTAIQESWESERWEVVNYDSAAEKV